MKSSTAKHVNNAGIPALVIGSGVTALGTLRSLGREKIPAYHVPITTSDDIASLSKWSTYSDGHLKAFNASGNLNDYLSKISLEKAVLFPCFDSAVEMVSRLDPELSSRFIRISPSKDVVEYLTDKGKFSALLYELDVPQPRTVPIRTTEDLYSLSDKYFERAFLKPCRSQDFLSRFNVKAFKIFSREDALEKFELVNKTGLSVLLQEYIHGSASDHYFIDGYVDRVGNIKALFARRRLRMYPLDFGNSSYMVSIPLDKVGDAVTSLKAIFKKTGFNGIFSAEFKNDPQDGLFKIIEINARPWWYVDFATKSGVNVCKLAYQDALSDTVSAIDDYTIGSTFIYPYYDYFAIMATSKNRLWGLAVFLRAFIFGRKPVFSWDDPRPAVVSLLKRVKSIIGNRIRRLFKTNRVVL